MTNGIRFAGVNWPHYVKITTVKGTTGVVCDVQIRWWHPGAWLMFARAVLRKWGVLPQLCATCAGNGRLMERVGSTRRMVCPDCHGRKVVRKKVA